MLYDEKYKINETKGQYLKSSINIKLTSKYLSIIDFYFYFKIYFDVRFRLRLFQSTFHSIKI